MNMFEGSFCESELEWGKIEQSYKELRERNLKNALVAP
jgi:hypothetical protein